MRAFTLFVHHSDSETPILLIEVVADLREARQRALRALAESDDRITVEVREDDRLLLVLDREALQWAQRQHCRPGAAIPLGCDAP